MKTYWQKIFLLIMFIWAMVSKISSMTFPTNWEVVPYPNESADVKAAPFHLDQTTVIAYPTGKNGEEDLAYLLCEFIEESIGYGLEVTDTDKISPSENQIYLCIDPTIANTEQYQIDISPESIVIRGGSERGLYYGIQTLRKTLPVAAPSVENVSPTFRNEIYSPSDIKRVNEFDFSSGYYSGSPRIPHRIIEVDLSGIVMTSYDFRNFLDILSFHFINGLKCTLSKEQQDKIGTEHLRNYASERYIDILTSVDSLSCEKIKLNDNDRNYIKRLYSVENCDSAMATVISIDASIFENYSDLQKRMLPRLAAATESLWMDAEQLDFMRFSKAIRLMSRYYRLFGWFYSDEMTAVDATIKSDATTKSIIIELSSLSAESTIMYSHPDFGDTYQYYDSPITITGSGVLKASSIQPDNQRSDFSQEFDFNKATFSIVKTDSTLLYGKNRNPVTMVDARRGNELSIDNDEWVGFNSIDGNPVELTIEMEHEQKVNTIEIGVFNDAADRILSPKQIDVLLSIDGKNYTKAKLKKAKDLSRISYGTDLIVVGIKAATAKFVKLVLHPSEQASKMYIDEIAIH